MLVAYAGRSYLGQHSCCFRKRGNHCFSFWFLWEWVWFWSLYVDWSFSGRKHATNWQYIQCLTEIKLLVTYTFSVCSYIIIKVVYGLILICPSFISSQDVNDRLHDGWNRSHVPFYWLMACYFLFHSNILLCSVFCY